MSKFPVESDDNVGVIDALNYLLSGPAGLGQNFSGFSSSTTQNMNLNIQEPFVVDGNVLDITVNIATTEYIDASLIKCTFASPPITNAFFIGNGLWSTGMGVATNYINNWGQTIGVVEITTTYLVIRLTAGVNSFSPISGGTLAMSMFTPNHTGKYFQTDCSALVNVTNISDRVFISGQLNSTILFSGTSSPYWIYNVAIKRYVGQINNYGTTPYTFVFDKYISVKQYFNSSTPTTQKFDTVFASIIDTPIPGYYYYTIEIEISRYGSSMSVGQIELGVRSLSAQVVKE